MAGEIPRPDLSPAQHRVLPLYASWMTLDKVARQLGISTGKASTHLKRARLKYAEPDRPAGTRVDLYWAGHRRWRSCPARPAGPGIGVLGLGPRRP